MVDGCNAWVRCDPDGASHEVEVLDCGTLYGVA
jgi:hypothetical protein